MGNAAMDNAIGQAILAMSDRLHEPVTVSELARVASFSRFHFSRLFQRSTGLPPGRFLSAMRLQEAKRLLVTTSMRVADISSRVGYASVGTFTTTFTSTVGISPTRFRDLGGHVPLASQSEPAPAESTLVAVVRPPAEEITGITFVGVFADGWPTTGPVSSTILNAPGPCRFVGVPHGEWWVVCAFTTVLRWRGQAAGDLLARTSMVATHGPYEVNARARFVVADVKAESIRTADDAIVSALAHATGG
ncbi:AraC family transcriptional regulator [Luedemannella helvata]|uniref:AraC family transcriptional regulator n=2 Tax=Luedemannella helvata TaxID=349315 RepID=A0ABP4X4E0_9ACTN